MAVAHSNTLIEKRVFGLRDPSTGNGVCPSPSNLRNYNHSGYCYNDPISPCEKNQSGKDMEEKPYWDRVVDVFTKGRDELIAEVPKSKRIPYYIFLTIVGGFVGFGWIRYLFFR